MTRTNDQILIDILHSEVYDDIPERELEAMTKPYINIEDCYDTENIAIICNEMNRKFSELNDLPVRAPWHELSSFEQESIISGVVAIKNDPGISPERNHDNWCKVKLMDGWKYGPLLDVEKKEHPCLVLYNELPRNQRVKDSLFITLVKGYLC